MRRPMRDATSAKPALGWLFILYDDRGEGEARFRAAFAKGASQPVITVARVLLRHW